ncbi:560_t:CDS:1, partial [Ambispora gerdemannii]
MEKQPMLSQQLITPNLVNTVQQLSTSLAAVQPINLANSETTQLITYTLIATAVV